MSSSTDRSYEQTTALLDALDQDPAESSVDLQQAKVVTRDLGDPGQDFSAGRYVGMAVRRALENQ